MGVRYLFAVVSKHGLAVLIPNDVERHKYNLQALTFCRYCRRLGINDIGLKLKVYLFWSLSLQFHHIK